MKASDIFEILDLTVRSRQQGRVFNPTFVSPPGIGKSEIVQQWAKSRGYGLVDIRTALLEAPDLIGFPLTEKVGDGWVTRNATPDMFPREGKFVLLYDEINRGNTSVMNALMQALTDRRIKDYVMPPEVIQVACINPETSTYDVNTMDPALKDRLEFFQVEYDRRVFVAHMKDKEWNPTVIHFIESNAWSYRPPEEVGNTPGAKYLSPRSFSKLNNAIQAGVPQDLELETYTSLLGDLVGKAFYQFKTKDQPVVFEDLIEHEKKSLNRLKEICNPKNYKTGHVSILQRSMIEHQKEVTNELLYKVAMVIGPEQAMGLIKEIEYKRDGKDLLNVLGKEFPDFAKYIRNTLKKEDVA